MIPLTIYTLFCFVTFSLLFGRDLYELYKPNIEHATRKVKDINSCSVIGHVWVQSDYGFGGNSPDAYIWVCERCGKWK